jgi:ABC-type transport system substrate-binding protein
MTLMDEAGYQENHLRAQEILAVDLPVVPLYLRINVTAARPDLCGFWMDPTAPSDTWNIEAYSIGQECR